MFYYIYKGVDWVIFPPIIFLGIGAMTDFGPLIANPKSMIIGAAAQLGIFMLIPIIQKPIMRALTTKEERKIKMKQLRKVSKFEKIAFPIYARKSA